MCALYCKGELIEMYGMARAELNADLKVQAIEVGKVIINLE